MANDVKGIKYSDLIQPDNSISEAVKQLEQLQKLYETMLKRIEEGAKGLQKPLSEGGGATEEGRKKIDAYEKQVRSLARAEVDLKLAMTDTAKEIAVLKQQQTDQTRLNKLVAKLNNSMAGSYNALSAQYELNKIKMNNLSQAYLENTEAGKKLVKETAEIYAAMDKYQRSTGKHVLNVGNYASAFDGLGFSVAQVARELPSLAISANTFFLAISNNIPMVVDELQKLIKANKEAAARGEETVSVMGRLAKSVISFNTVLTIALTIFSIYGKDIIKWVVSLFKGRDAVNKLAVQVKALNDAMKAAKVETVNETFRLKTLYGIATNANKPYADRVKAIKVLRRENKEYFKDFTDEEILAGKAAKAYDTLSAAIIKNAKSKAALDKIKELQKEYIDLQEQVVKNETDAILAQNKLGESIAYQSRNIPKWASFLKKASVINIPLLAKNLFDKKRIDDFNNAADNARDRMAAIQTSMEELAKMVTVDAFDPDKGTEAKTKKAFDLLSAYEDSRIQLIRDSRQKEIEERTKQADDELKKLKESTTEQQRQTQQYADTVRNIQLKLVQDLNDMRQNWFADDLKKQHDYLEERIRATRSGSADEMLIRMQLLENERKQDEIAIASSLESEEVKNARLLILDRAYLLSRIQLQKEYTDKQNKFILDRSVFHLHQQQESEEAAFNIVQRSAKEQEVFRLKAERQKWEQILELTRLYGSKITGYEIKTVEDTIKGIDNTIKQKASSWDSEQGVFGNLFDLMFGGAFGDKGGKSGKERSEEFKQSIADASEYAIENLKSVAQARVEAAEKAVQAAEKEVSARQKVLDAEIQARANGYANNVATAQKELDFARKQQEKALRDKKKAQKAQERIDTLMQASSLVTATANLWKDLGLAAIPAIALMWGSFAFAKIKASQLSKASDQTEEYGNGTVEMIDYGGSHASGNDVDLGTTKDGKRRRVEKGEYFAVINKRSSQRYRRLVPDLINSLNKGTFEQKYLNAYSGADEVTNIMQGGNIDLSNVERDLKSIKESAGHKFITGADGTIIEVKGNVKRIIKTK